MKNKYFMIDLESMGLDFDQDDIIQIGILEITKDVDGYYHPNKSFMQTLYTDQEPKNDWIKENHKDLLPLCRQTNFQAPIQVRAGILAFMQSCGVNQSAQLMGLNATSFDIPYMVHKGYLKKEDFHYRIYELRGAYALAMDVLNVSDKELFKAASESCPWIKLPEGKKHQALYDCYNQLKTLNGITRLLKK